MAAFTDDAIEAFVVACERAMDVDGLEPATFAAVCECGLFWKQVREERKTVPYSRDATATWGRYVIIRISQRPSRDEWTNIGVMVYDKAGDQVWAKIGPFDRAKQRGDMNRPWPYLADYPKQCARLIAVKRALRSATHYMSCVQLTKPRGMNIDPECCWHLYQSMVLGIERS